MKFCMTCNRSAEDSLNYCSRDGGVLNAGDRYCPECTHILDRHFNYCPAHGIPLAWAPSDSLPLPPDRVVAPHATPKSGRRVLRGLGAAAASLVLFVAGALLGTYTAGADTEQHVEQAPSASAVSPLAEVDSKIKEGSPARIRASAAAR